MQPSRDSLPPNALDVIEAEIVEESTSRNRLNGVTQLNKPRAAPVQLIPAREGLPLYERLKGETSKAYEAFCLYRDQGVSRSLQKVSDALGKSNVLMARWSSRYHWVERAAEWDVHVDRQRRAQSEEARAAMNERHAQTAGALLAKALQRLQQLDVAALDARDVRNFIVAATDLERKARGAPDETVKHEHEQSGEVQVQVKYVGDWRQ